MEFPQLYWFLQTAKGITMSRMQANPRASRWTRRNRPWQFENGERKENRWTFVSKCHGAFALVSLTISPLLDLSYFPHGRPPSSTRSALASRWHRSNRSLPALRISSDATLGRHSDHRNHPWKLNSGSADAIPMFVDNIIGGETNVNAGVIGDFGK